MLQEDSILAIFIIIDIWDILDLFIIYVLMSDAGSIYVVSSYKGRIANKTLFIHSAIQKVSKEHEVGRRSI